MGTEVENKQKQKQMEQGRTDEGNRQTAAY